MPRYPAEAFLRCALDAVVMRALAKDRSLRYRTIEEFAQAFDEATDGSGRGEDNLLASEGRGGDYSGSIESSELRVGRPLGSRRSWGLVAVGLSLLAVAILAFIWRFESADLQVQRELTRIEADILKGALIQPREECALQRWNAAADRFPGRVDIAKAKKSLIDALRAQGKRSLDERRFDEAVALFTPAVALEGGAHDLNSELVDAKRGAFATREGMVPAGAVFIDRYEYPNQRGVLPLTHVDFSAASDLCKGAGKRLCTEEEWEQACSGPRHQRYPFGDGENASACAVQGGLNKGPLKSGSVSTCTSPFGAMDMNGNVAEWTATSLKPGAPQMIVRGGSWESDLAHASCQSRDYFMPGQGGARTIGFRCCY